MTLDRQDVRILVTIRRAKLDHKHPEYWVNAMDLAQEIRRPPDDLARALRDLSLRGLLDPAPISKPIGYGDASAFSPRDTRYGLTPEGARLARQYSTPAGQHDLLKRQVVQVMKRYRIELSKVTMTLGELRGALTGTVEQHELLLTLRDLQGEGYIEQPFYSEAVPENIHFTLTAAGHSVASHLERGGDWPALGNPQPTVQTTTTNNFNGPNHGVIQAGDYNTASITHQVTPDVLRALEALVAKVAEIPDPADREEAEFYAARVNRAAREGLPVKQPLDRLFTWLVTNGQRVTGAAVLWDLAGAVAGQFGIPVPPAPLGLGQ